MKQYISLILLLCGAVLIATVTNVEATLCYDSMTNCNAACGGSDEHCSQYSCTTWTASCIVCNCDLPNFQT
uniref:ShKT domain-containing protein n=1 Tax=Octopus bimaculoides TaxID=37653 RepID=A0A0L8H122_OCTBM